MPRPGGPSTCPLTPLWHVTLVSAGPEHHVVVMSLHHAIADGWSLDIILREISRTYGELLRAPGTEALSPAPVQYAEAAAWQRETAPDDADFWRSHLEGTTSAYLPTDRPRPLGRPSEATRSR